MANRHGRNAFLRVVVWTAIALPTVTCSTAMAAQSARPAAPSSDQLIECPASDPLQPGSLDTNRVMEILRQGQQAALTGDRTSAREFLAEAVRLDPTNPDAAYNHARLLEELGDTVAARREYCRFLSLPISPSDSVEVSGRLAALRPSEPGPSDQLFEAMARGRQLLAQNNPRAAEQAFNFVIYQDPIHMEAYLNRAIAREARGRRNEAIRDYGEYLRIAPAGEERARIEAHVAALIAALPSPGSVATRGLLLPGLGQISTGRPALGVATLLTVGAGAALAASQTRITTRTAVFVDPFDIPREYEIEERVRPYLVPAVVGGLAVTIAAAFEAYLHSRSLHQAAASIPVERASSERRILPLVEGSADGESLRLGFQLKLGS